MKFEIYTDKKGEYRWRVTAANGEIVGASSEGFMSMWYCEHNARLLCEGLVNQFHPPSINCHG